MTTTLSRWSHACIRLERGEDRLVIDPGMFTDLDAALDGVTAILVTHEHGDHLEVDGVAAAIRRGAQVWGPGPALALLAEAGAPADALHEVAGGDHITAGGFEVDVVGEWHARIHPDVPLVPNVGYLVERVLHPGDSVVAVEPDAVDVLMLPLAGPWLSSAEAIDFVRAVAPRQVVVIHDAHLSEPGQQLYSMLVARLGGAGQPVRLAPGESIEL
ncbi:MBL fold metallo-hydrolase [Cellulomonas edaphi]|uniref:MBL fold metallo-hydrolase n=1 Tax=Cellulomonas edaphi TaxID=3053468 RepID=A0ABT7S6C7_9CELL|nr:MBL fold metallo-hydrolase [Cellulomons edaphi]MDM7831161.1 MBL fold metallo-hydrolase [Cellulomons edaphi]